jgi:hypothetical protein
LPTRDLHLELLADPSPDLARAVRRLIEAIERPIADDEALVSRLSMAAHELVENAVEYGVGGPISIRIALDEGAAASITLTNEAAPEHVARLRARVTDVAGWQGDEMPSMYQAYLRRRIGTEESGLGLARVRAEAEMRLEAKIAGSTVTVTATGGAPRAATIVEVDAGAPSAGPPLAESELSASAEAAGGVLNARLAGTADLRTRPRLQKFVAGLQAEALRHRVREVVVDVRRLAFMNSSCLKVLVNWIVTVDGLPAASSYRIVFVEDPAQLWQQRGLKALAGLSPERVSIRSA